MGDPHTAVSKQFCLLLHCLQASSLEFDQTTAQHFMNRHVWLLFSTFHKLSLSLSDYVSCFSGIWPDGADGTDINAVCRSHDGSLLASADDFGKVCLFSYPCSQPRVSPVHSVRHISTGLCMLTFIFHHHLYELMLSNRSSPSCYGNVLYSAQTLPDLSFHTVLLCQRCPQVLMNTVWSRITERLSWNNKIHVFLIVGPPADI